METLEQKVKRILAEYFDENEIQLDDNPDRRVSGFIISPKFLDVDDFERQTKISGLLRKNLSVPEQKRVIGLFPFTPEEYQAYREPSL
ncbi:hypothetical protein HUU05_21465 [candidate division KSB1 bacterium]|nr:hypothetical protein [candidate division KSB1 bacterium]